MPIITFTQKDLNKLQPVDPGWYPAVVSAITEELSSKKDSMNYKVTFTINPGDPDAERDIENTFNEKAFKFNQVHDFIEACIDGKIQPGQSFELYDFKDVKLFIELSKEIYKNANNPNDRGRPINKIINFQSASNPPF